MKTFKLLEDIHRRICVCVYMYILRDTTLLHKQESKIKNNKKFLIF